MFILHRHRSVLILTVLAFLFGFWLKELAILRGSNSYIEVGYPESNMKPSSRDLFLPRNEDTYFLQSKLEEIFDKKLLSEEEKAISIMKFVASSLRMQSNDGSATKMLKDGYAICGGMSYIFIMLCRKADLATRYVGTSYLPSISSHAMAEVYYDNKWHLFDPTFGVFFYSQADYRKGSILSFQELISKNQSYFTLKVVPKPWTGLYDTSIKTFIPVLAEPAYLKDIYGLSIEQIYKEIRTESFPIAYSSSDLVSYPVDVDLGLASEVWFGQVDKSNSELAKYSKRFSGSHYLGLSTPNAYHTWLIKAPKNSRLKIEYYSLTEAYPTLTLLPLRSVKLISSRNSKRKVSFWLEITDPEAIVSVYCRKSTFLVDAMRVIRK
ncbi:MAG: hypothetical protein JNN15_10465 [Blastocatellia bacterium]|nr:hypothetical protein [Blastocatellia bacterium]